MGENEEGPHVNSEDLDGRSGAMGGVACPVRDMVAPSRMVILLGQQEPEVAGRFHREIHSRFHGDGLNAMP
ncbi:MAG: hypothetical protein JWP26_1272 [Devosia sp.]|nr:hypothetical protein [Devosia sp.]MDB5586302.1 hypothetical protein [Devosia sp.]